ncbi:MAG: helix-hairpin-helix domain-containing protein [Armatimonadota bacterium]
MTGLNFSRNAQIALVFVIGISLLGLAYGHIRSANRPAVDSSRVSIVDGGPNTGIAADAPAVTPSRSSGVTREVVVHVAGCVKKPSVYRLSPDSRVIDAIHMAGGPTSDARLDAINLAARVQDGTQILVPSKNTAAPPAVGQPIDNSRSVASAPPSSRASRGASSLGLVNINTAGLGELDQLPGIGPVTAQKIIDYRNQIGRFSTIEQLENVKGIGPKKLEQIRPYVRL